VPETQTDPKHTKESPSDEGSEPTTSESDAEGSEDKRLVCNVAFCPICLAVTAAGGAAPDALEHLLSAAREFFLAARAVIDVRGDQLSGEEPSPNGSGDLEKIEIS
jgi:hypothetical protein